MSPSLASEIRYSNVCDVYERIAKARGNKKIEELNKFLDQCRRTGRELKIKDSNADVSLFPVMRLFLPGADRERGAHGLKEKALAALFVRILCLGKNSSDGQKLINYKAPQYGESGMGDFAEKLYWILKGRQSNVKCTLSVEKLNAAIDTIAQLNADNMSKDDELLSLVKQLGPLELKWVTRTILKDLKLGMGQRRVLEAYHPDADQLFSEKSNLRQVCDTLIDRHYRVQKDISNIVVLSPFKPMLLERCKIEDVGKFFTNNESYFVQTKYDGERSQIHMKDGIFKYYTRHGTDITNNWAYGETTKSGGFLTRNIAPLLSPDCRSIILDGELMGWNKDRKTLGSKGMPFDVKKLTAKSRHQPCFVAFDIVMYNDQLLVNVPYKDRLSLLNTAFQEADGILLRSSITTISTSDQLLSVFNASLDTKEEGIVLKRSDGLYKPNTREGSGCYKIKAEYSDGLIQDIDLIVLGGYYGEGKCAGIFNTFLMGVSGPGDDKNNSTKQFYSVVSVSTGLGIEKLKELQTKFKPHWIKECPSIVLGPKKHPPDAWIHPKHSIVLQLRATELTRCSVHPAGYTLRFPRVVRVRDDKPWEDAWTLSELRAMIKDGGFVQKATKRHATSSDIRESSKMPRNVRPTVMRVDEKYLGIQSVHVPRLTRLLHGKEFCVINGEELLLKEDKLRKTDIERILYEHSAKVVQNPGKHTFAGIVGNPRTERVKNLMTSKKWDVVKLDWLRRVTDEKNWHRSIDWFPWEMISSTKSTEARLTSLFDEYEDSFVNDADEESLKRSLKKAQECIQQPAGAFDEIQELESQLFDNGISPFSLFRNIIGYFDDSSDCRIHEFTFMSGTVKESIDSSVTHVFVNEIAACLIDLYKQIDECGTVQIKILNSSWIQDCFKQQTMLPDENYVVG